MKKYLVYSINFNKVFTTDYYLSCHTTYKWNGGFKDFSSMYPTKLGLSSLRGRYGGNTK